MPFSLPTEAQSAAQLVDYLADPHRYFLAYQQLIRLGAEAAGPARAGLQHENPRVRMHCCRVLDHVMDPGSIPALVGAWAHTHREAAEALLASASGDPSPTVRKKAAWYAPGGTIYRRKAGYPVSQ